MPDAHATCRHQSIVERREREKEKKKRDRAQRQREGGGGKRKVKVNSKPKPKIGHEIGLSDSRVSRAYS